MTKVYITFGQVHAHRVNGKTFDKDCVALIEADDEMQGREIAFSLFGDKFCFSYFNKLPPMEYFPRGVISVDD